MDPLRRLAAILADGRFHSGRVLGETLGVGRTSVWNYVQALQAAGLEIFAVRRRGYRLARPLELLERERILACMSPTRRGRLRSVDVLFSVDSTNRHLADAARDGLEPPAACVAEAQSAGRGRCGRAWISPLACNLYLSLLWRLDAPPGGPGALGLVAGVAVAEALESTGLEGLELKWPNDLLCAGEKLGGILVEASGGADDVSFAVIGIGLNVSMPRADAAAIDQPWTDLRTQIGEAPSRNELAGKVLDRLVVALDRFAVEGFAAFRDAWSQRDALRDREVDLHEAGGVARGVARGVDESGALRVERDGVARRVVAGDVTLRGGEPR